MEKLTLAPPLKMKIPVLSEKKKQTMLNACYQMDLQTL